MEAGGNSGVFVWSDAEPDAESRLPNGVEVQMLELEWPNLNKEDGVTPPIAYVHGELFGVGGVTTTPDNPRGERSKSIENRAQGQGQWNTYDVVAVDGVIKLAVNGKFVNGISRSTKKKGYLCLESEGGEIHFRNIRHPRAATRDRGTRSRRAPNSSVMAVCLYRPGRTAERRAPTPSACRRPDNRARSPAYYRV